MAKTAGAPLTVYGAPYSVYVRIALLALNEKGVPFTLEPVDIFAKSETTDAYAALNPFGKIPAIRHGDLVLYETRAITRYVDEAFDGPALQPSAPADRARMAQVMGIVDSFAYRTLVWDIYVSDVARRKGEGDEPAGRIAAALPLAETCLGEFARLLGNGPFFGGRAPSLADLHVAPVFGYFGTVPEAEALLARFPTLSDWWTNVSARTSWRAVCEYPAD